MDEEENDDVSFDAVEWKVNRYDVIVVAATLIQGVAEAIVASANLTRRLAGGHANWLESRRRFVEDASMEIESLPTTEE
jgi:hypothetical protein